MRVQCTSLPKAGWKLLLAVPSCISLPRAVTILLYRQLCVDENSYEPFSWPWLAKVLVFRGCFAWDGSRLCQSILQKLNTEQKASQFSRRLKPWPNGLASRRKFTNPELAYGLAKGGQTDSQVAKSRKFYLRSTCVDLRWVAKRWKTCVYSRPNFSSTKVHASPRKSSQIDASRGKWVAKRTASSKLASTWVRLARA